MNCTAVAVYVDYEKRKKSNIYAITCFSPCLQDYQEVITSLPEFDKPSYFGLPENIERSAQRIISMQVISQLRILQRADVKASRFDKEVWATELGPVLNLWKKLNQVSVEMLIYR